MNVVVVNVDIFYPVVIVVAVAVVAVNFVVEAVFAAGILRHLPGKVRVRFNVAFLNMQIILRYFHK